jgi:hypothetical protein
MSDNQIEFLALSRIEIRAKKIFDDKKLNLSIYNNGKLKKVFMTEVELRISELVVYNKYKDSPDTMIAVI